MPLKEFVYDVQNRPWRLSHLRDDERDYTSLAEVIQDATRRTNVESRLAAKQYISLKEFAAFYLPDNCPDRENTIDNFVRLHQLCLPSEGRWYIGARTLVPFLTSGIDSTGKNHIPIQNDNRYGYDLRSNTARLATQLNEPPRFTWFSPNPHFGHEDIKKNVVRALLASSGKNKPFAEELEPKGYTLLPHQRLFRLTNGKDQTTSQYIIIEEDESLLHQNSLFLHYAISNGSDLQSLFTLQLGYGYSSCEPQERWTNWDEDEGKSLQFLNGVPYISLSLDTQKTLASPMHMGKNEEEASYGIDVDQAYLEFNGLLESCAAWNRDSYLISGDTEAGTAHYYRERR